MGGLLMGSFWLAERWLSELVKKLGPSDSQRTSEIVRPAHELSNRSRPAAPSRHRWSMKSNRADLVKR